MAARRGHAVGAQHHHTAPGGVLLAHGAAQLRPGPAAGDLTAFGLGWGFTVSIAVFAVAILIPWALHRTGLLGEVAAFWGAYILTRPLGATVADWLGKPFGAGLGDGTVTLAALALIAVLVGYLALRRPDVQAAPQPAAHSLRTTSPQPQQG